MREEMRDDGENQAWARVTSKTSPIDVNMSFVLSVLRQYSAFYALS